MESDNPFHEVPTSPPISTDPPPASPMATPTPSGRRRGRSAVVAVAAVGLLGTGVFGVAQLASAGPSEGAAVPPGTTDDSIPDTDERSDEQTDDEQSDDSIPDETDDTATDDTPSVDGEIVVDLGDGDPIEIDLGELDAAGLDEFRECAGLPDIGAPFELDTAPWVEGEFDELLGDLDAELDEWLAELDDRERPDIAAAGGVLGAAGDHITVFGPDGLSVIDLGDDDATVTITKQDGEITITTDGDATVEDLPDLFEPPIEFPIEHLDELFEDFSFDDAPIVELPELGDLGFELPDPDVVQDCLDDLG